MDEQPIDIPCPICKEDGQLRMVANVDEIPYFGEHTQVTVLCHACGWRQTDFIPAEGKKAGAWSLTVDSTQKLRSRVVRSSSCTVRIPELELEVMPGTNSTGYVSNIEGVLNRFVDIINMVRRDVERDIASNSNDEDSDHLNSLTTLDSLLKSIQQAGDESVFTVEFLDPHGHSMILDDDASERELTAKELEELPIGPDPVVFSSDDDS
ncbi:MAG: ZPR1 zinc finger domain-containing protein [Euryarchaeota archaeon]|jgi:zinc finger protein|nr:ZPR1 zinc finger domain-containing protein [Euryarchaeota archaeon]MBT5594022.1 ZPR1 zinc finger domain-containing protein [Euryarchaeota archaeon]MBT5844534.1 ZPR1 zinc finger domain-containing protein [Euryarchaeota archaeon]MBT6641245.1 ZPR1 zinc finger domain-containing protein [Euryarchaeota archaeon]MBT6844670.1 ZPR1 zinc finger domain-containing protein [Euryarchaeota archaeon]